MNIYIKKIIYLGLIITVISLLFYSNKINKKSENKKEIIQAEQILKIEIIDQYNLMKQLYEEPYKEEYVAVDIVINGKYYKDIGIRTKGSSIYSYIKKTDNPKKHSFKIKLDYINKEQEYAGIKEFHLNTGVPDKTGIREYLVYDIYNKMGIETQKYALGEMYINGIQNGFVTVIETINEEYVQNKYKSLKGNLYKPENVEMINCLGADLRYKDDEIDSYQAIFNNVVTTHTQEQDEKQLIKILKDINQKNITEEIIEKRFIDFNKIIKMIAINTVVTNLDSFAGKTTRNYYLYEEDGKIDIIPFDFNMSFGLNTNKNVWNEEDFNKIEISKMQQRGAIICEIISNNQIYTKKYYQYLKETIELMQDADIINKIEEINIKLSNIKKQEKNLLYTYEDYKDEIKQLEKFIQKRNSSIIESVF